MGGVSLGGEDTTAGGGGGGCGIVSTCSENVTSLGLLVERSLDSAGLGAFSLDTGLRDLAGLLDLTGLAATALLDSGAGDFLREPSLDTEFGDMTRFSLISGLGDLVLLLVAMGTNDCWVSMETVLGDNSWEVLFTA